MSNVGSLVFHSALAAAIVAGGLLVGCVNNDPADDKSTAGTGNASGGSSTAGTSTAGGGSEAAGTSGSGGSAGTASLLPACATVATASGTSPLITDFESMTAATGTYTFESAGLLGGTYIYSDNMAPAADPSTSALSFAEGHEAASTQALDGKIHNATWGGGMGLWFACMDASAYSGITFWARGNSPAGSVKVNLSLNEVEVESKGGHCPDAGAETMCVRPYATFDVTDEWTQHTLAWGDFMPGSNGATPVPGSGQELYGIDFGIPNDNTSRELELVVDDFSFTK